MTHPVIWLPEAMASYRQLRAADPDGDRRVVKAVAAIRPRPIATLSEVQASAGYGLIGTA